MWLRGSDESKSLQRVSVDIVFQYLRGKETLIHRKGNNYIILSELNSHNVENAHFSYTDFFSVSIKTFPSDEKHFKIWRKEIEDDPFVLMTFKSEQEHVFNMIFQFKKPCKNKKIFSRFIRVFTIRFFARHNIPDEVDNNNCDPCSRIYLSEDKDSFLRIGGKLVVLEDYEKGEENEIFYERRRKHEEKVAKRQEENKQNKFGEPNKHQLSIIKKILNQGVLNTDKEKREVQRRKIEKILAKKERLKEKLDENGVILRGITTVGEIIKITVGCGGKEFHLNLIFTEKQCVITAMGKEDSGILWEKILKDIISKYADEIINENI